MYRSRLSLSLLLAVVAASACSEPSPAAPDAPEEAAFTPLVSAPLLTWQDLVAMETIVEEPGAPDRPTARTSEWELESHVRPVQQIFDPGTRVGYGGGFASSIGDHRYIGNVGFVSTTAHVTYNDQDLGSQTATRQKYMPFLADWGMVKHIDVAAKVYTDHECGLTVRGESEHRAWWQFFQGRGVAEWGVEVKSTQAKPVPQGSCSESTGTRRATEDQGGGILCTYYITYDVSTGAIIDAELLYCTSKGGTVI